MKLYSYIVVHDTGFAPNPFHGYCTLACCKPGIRISIGKELSDSKGRNHTERGEYWIAGLSPRDHGRGNKIIYIMKVKNAVPFEDYFSCHKYRKKKPNMNSGKPSDRCGDNIYERLGERRYRQLRSMHSGKSSNENKARDLSGKYVLVSPHFFYFGSKPRALPPNLQELIVGRGYRCKFENEQEVYSNFLKFVGSLKVKGIIAPPTRWKAGDMSWKGC